jgi:hypothetical protein
VLVVCEVMHSGNGGVLGCGGGMWWCARHSLELF